ncbi:hypothetical protein D3C80_1267000 [compost metagenome]
MIAATEITTAVLVAVALANAVFRSLSVTVTVVTPSLDAVAGVKNTCAAPASTSAAAAAGTVGVAGVTAPPPPPPPELPPLGCAPLTKRNEV